MHRSSYTTAATIRRGKLVLGHITHWQAALQTFRDGPVLVTVQDARRVTRSAQANALYWAAYVRPLCDYTGDDPMTVHSYLKDKFLPHPVIVIANADGEIVDERPIARPTTTTLTPPEFSDYLRHVGAFAGELGVETGSR